jgi:hypothetical protein
MRLVVAICFVVLAAFSAVAQGQAPTLRIVTEDPTLPSELYYGDVKVKPLRLRPGTNQRITIDDNDFFIQQHYIDFLGRFPEPAGFQGWLNILSNCPAGDTRCDRIEVSSAFYRSPEFQERGYFVYKFYTTSLGRFPRYEEFGPDVRRINGFQTPEQLEANKAAFANDFTQRADFKSIYDSITDPAAYVDKLLTTAGVTLPQRNQLISDLQNGRKTRAQVLREVAESSEVSNKYFNQAFVVMQYFGYLRRNPDILYLNWIETLNRTGDYRTMINGFVNSLEYRNRF